MPPMQLRVIADRANVKCRKARARRCVIAILYLYSNRKTRPGLMTVCRIVVIRTNPSSTGLLLGNLINEVTISPLIKNHMKKNIEHEMETGII